MAFKPTRDAEQAGMIELGVTDGLALVVMALLVLAVWDTDLP